MTPPHARRFDEEMMKRAIPPRDEWPRAASNLIHWSAAVLVKNDNVIAEGFHANLRRPPTPSQPPSPPPVSRANRQKGATAYVTLEPCCHTNKKTPPCVPALINAKIGRIVVGCVDPNPDVNGKGLDELRAAGIEVEANVLEDSAKQLRAIHRQDRL